MSEPLESAVVSSAAALGAAVPIFRVESLDASLAYYVERLGFQLQWRSNPTASVGRDRMSLMLVEGDQGQPGSWVWVPAADVDQLCEELQKRGALLRHPPANYPWGSRECQVTDPDGNVIRFGSDCKPGEPFGDWLDGERRRWTLQPDGTWRAAP